jgi:hypothetical protein
MGTTTTTPQAAGTTTPNAQPQAAPLPTWAQHRNPKVARVLAAVAGNLHKGHGNAGKYGSMAAMCRALGCTAKADQREVRQVLRDAGMGVGRGRVYTGDTGSMLRRAAQHNAAQAAKVAKQAKQAAKG